MQVHYLQHVEFEGLGSIEPWVRAAGHGISRTRLYRNEQLPTTDQFDWLIILGGPMRANDAKFSWLNPEKTLIRQSIDSGKRILGICLGAQLIASVLGARVYKNIHQEIGWFEIRRSREAAEHPLGSILPESIDAFHWHRDTFDLPSGAVRLASSEACHNQAFAFGRNVLALQFHLESTPEGTVLLIDKCSEDLMPGSYIQKTEQMLSDSEKFEQINRVMASVLNALAGVGPD